MEYVIVAVVVIIVIALVILLRKPADDDFVQIVVEDKPVIIPAEELHQIPVHRVIKAKLKGKKAAVKKPVK